ncbi:hypothetical protein ACHAXA_005987 [Cyclostephanos tholiformis]|uniref:Uncharacterized protein n=1 Tax=Cyclostephanos tholiformis TaxID=382380 RepID=A0ABD3SQM8_9STRA
MPRCPIGPAMAVLSTMLVANLLALGVHVWRFLPPPDIIYDDDHRPRGHGKHQRRERDGRISSRLGAESPMTTASGGGSSSTSSSVARVVHDSAICRASMSRMESTNRTAGRPSSSISSSSSFDRYDAVSIMLDCMVDDGRGAYGVSHMLPSIPIRRRMIPENDRVVDGRVIPRQRYVVPSDAAWNLTYFLESRVRPDEEDRPLYLYNPMLLPLDPRHVGDTILDDLLGKDDDDDEDLSPPAYVAVYRVSNFGNCHGPGRGRPGTYRNYLGLTLLDAHLNIVRGRRKERRDIDDGRDAYYSTDVVIDLNRHFFPRGGGETPGQIMEDCQLIAAPSPSSSGGGGGTVGNVRANGLVLLCNNHAMRVRLERASRPPPSGGMILENTYGSGLRLTVLEEPRIITMGGKRMLNWKNLHYFRADSTMTGGEDGVASAAAAGGGGGDGDGYLEIWPGGPHETIRVDLANYNGTIVRSSGPEPRESFVAVDGDRPLLTPRDRGSACCVSIRWQDGDDSSSNVGGGRRLLMGFSHRKTRNDGKARLAGTGYNYVSRVYAFEPTPPFDIVARSGFFCLGFAPAKRSDDAPTSMSRSSDERSRAVPHPWNYESNASDNEQVWGAANNYKLKINGTVYDNCPAIHFVTGLADKMGDEEETVIISYGVNDCYPRMIEVPKRFLVSLLKQPPKQ